MRPGHSRRGGNWCVNCGVTAGRITHAYVSGKPLPCIQPDTPCGHPLAARAIESEPPFGDLRTVCWACRIERQIDGDAYARARAKWDNSAAGTSSHRIDSPTPPSPLLVPGSSAALRMQGRD